LTFDTFLRRLGTRVQKARWVTGKTQEEVAWQSGITYRHYQELERGKVNPTARTLYALARVLGRSIAELVDVEPRLRGRSMVSLADVEATPPKRGRKPKATSRKGR
jgi:transcriptional regulator with XRE-family HTH domain